MSEGASKKGQTVIWNWDDDNRGTFRNQEITDIVGGPGVEDDGHVEGIWKGRHVAAFSFMANEWYPI